MLTPEQIDLKDFAQWLATQPANDKYDYCDSWNCPVARYLQEKGVMKYNFGVLPNPLHDLLVDRGDRTYGGAAKRVLEYLANGR